uniref:Uncharacterized LOC106946854 n=1 Tax=Poecilia latipinna TaxID=48699 RepID=A0A3B3V8N5_9TELE
AMTSRTLALYAATLLVVTMDLTQRSPLVYSVDVGSNAVLQCLCQDDSAVMFYWYKQILGQEPKLMCTLYKHTNTAVFKEEFNNSRFSLDTGNHRNVVLKISDVKISDAATFHCVRSNLNDYEFCEGTTLSERFSLVLVYLLSGALTFTTLLAATLAFSVFKMNKRQHAASVVLHICPQESQDGENLQYASVSHQKTNIARTKTDGAFRECVYSSVKR